jgi:cytochrome P450
LSSTARLLAEFPTLHDVTVIADYDEVRQILASPKFVQGAYELTGSNLMRDVLNSVDGEDHRKRRRIMARLFSERALASYRTEHLEPVIARSLREVSSESAGGKPVRADLVPLLWRILFRVAAGVTGIDGLESADAVNRFIRHVATFGRALTAEWAKEDPDGLIRQGTQARRRIAEDFYAPSAARRSAMVQEYRSGTRDADSLPADLITMLLLHLDPDWDEDLPLREVSVFLMAATQTTTQAFPHFIIQLEKWLDEHPGHRQDIMGDQEFLRRAAYEALRLFVASPARIRRATEDVVLNSGRHISADERVALFFRSASASAPVFGANPEVFDPRREYSGVAPWGLAFGGGAHACIGRPMVTGVGSRGQSDGTIVHIARALYRAGLRLDPDREPVLDATTYYDAYESVPVLFGNL